MSNIIGMNFAHQVHSKASEGKIRKNTLLSALSKNVALLLIAIMFVVGSIIAIAVKIPVCLLYTSPSPRD